MSEKDLAVAIIGYGRIGKEHAGWLAKCKDIRLTAVADVTAGRRKLAAERGLTTYETIEQLLAGSRIDAVLVSTPTSMHFEHASAALSAGKHVLVEKPMALNLPQSRKLIELAKKHGRVLSVFHNRRWDADFLTVKQAVNSNVFGKRLNIESRLGQWSSCVGYAAPEYHPNWRNERAFGGGVLFDWGSHLVDQILQLLLPAKPVRVFAQLRGNVWSSDCDDFARVCIDFDNGVAAVVEINTTTKYPPPRWHIDGTNGSGQSPYSLEYDTQKWAKLDFLPADGKSSQRIPRASVGLSEMEIWERFAGAILGKCEPAVTAESVLPTMQLLDAARTSSERGIAVNWETPDVNPGLQ